MGIKDDVNVNRFRLDEECEKQAAIYHNYAEALADARTATDAAKDLLSLDLAEEEIRIRAEFEANGTKATEASVKAALETQEKIKASRKQLREAQARQYEAEAAVKAMEHRKSELDNLTTLFSRAYFSLPEGSRGVTSQVGGSVRDQLNRRG